MRKIISIVILFSIYGCNLAPYSVILPTEENIEFYSKVVTSYIDMTKESFYIEACNNKFPAESGRFRQDIILDRKRCLQDKKEGR